MLTLSCVLEIRRHLDEGRLSQRKIAALMGVSRSTVGLIATGRRPMVGRQEETDPSPWDYYHDALPQRCRQCGGMVFMPCVLCRTRACQRRQASVGRAGDCRRATSSERSCVAKNAKPPGTTHSSSTCSQCPVRLHREGLPRTTSPGVADEQKRRPVGPSLPPGMAFRFD
ncbi:MAG: helix-turn-helix transcriptional regulator [Planctomycetales bacterium]|nr:helix-turn-helix transcriptional regulator [Planctomycetales bacterium]